MSDAELQLSLTRELTALLPAVIRSGVALGLSGDDLYALALDVTAALCAPVRKRLKRDPFVVVKNDGTLLEMNRKGRGTFVALAALRAGVIL